MQWWTVLNRFELIVQNPQDNCQLIIEHTNIFETLGLPNKILTIVTILVNGYKIILSLLFIFPGVDITYFIYVA